VHFYRYANIDPINYFEEDARKQWMFRLI
jgi:hypothetical protein